MRLILSNSVWEVLEPLLQKAKRSQRGPKPDLSERMFLEALLHLARTGEPWRDLPSEFGDWNAVYQRFKRWRRAGNFSRLFADLPRDPLLDEVRRLFVDSTIIRAHPHAAGAKKKNRKPRKPWDEVEAVMEPRST
jgi:transposase